MTSYSLLNKRMIMYSALTFKINSLVNYFLDFMKSTGPSYVYGFSLGGYIALSAALKDETNFKGIVTQGTKFNWTKDEADKETKSLNVEFLSSKAEGFYNYLLDLHGRSEERRVGKECKSG